MKVLVVGAGGREHAIARISLELSSRGTGSFETLTAIPIDDFIAGL